MTHMRLYIPLAGEYIDMFLPDYDNRSISLSLDFTNNSKPDARWIGSREKLPLVS